MTERKLGIDGKMVTREVLSLTHSLLDECVNFTHDLAKVQKTNGVEDIFIRHTALKLSVLRMEMATEASLKMMGAKEEEINDLFYRINSAAESMAKVDREHFKRDFTEKEKKDLMKRAKEHAEKMQP